MLAVHLLYSLIDKILHDILLLHSENIAVNDFLTTLGVSTRVTKMGVQT